MYSSEIAELMTKRQNKIFLQDYYDILFSSPQICHVHYDVFSNKIQIYTDDDYRWEFEVHKD